MTGTEGGEAIGGRSRADDVLDICELKHRYFRHLDLKEFDDLGALLTDDATATYGDVVDRLSGRPAIVEFLRGALGGSDIVSLHNGHHPEITFSDPMQATGRWYLVDRVFVPAADLEIGGSAIYDDLYVRSPAGWRIAHTGYRRIFEEHRRHSTGELLSFTTRFDPRGAAGSEDR